MTILTKEEIEKLKPSLHLPQYDSIVKIEDKWYCLGCLFDSKSSAQNFKTASVLCD